MKSIDNRKIIDELIKIADILPYSDVVPDYDSEIKERTKQKDFNQVLGELWNEILTKFPVAAEYAETISHTEIGEVLFPIHKGIDEIRLNVQNFIRLMRIRNNMRLVALVVRQNLLMLEARKMSFQDLPETGDGVRAGFVKFPDGFAPIFLPDEKYGVWQDERYIVNEPNKQNYVPFEVELKNKSNKMIGVFKLIPSPMEEALNKIDSLQIKTCINCYKIFFADPRNVKFCSEKCRDRTKSRKHYYSKKLK